MGNTIFLIKKMYSFDLTIQVTKVEFCANDMK